MSPYLSLRGRGLTPSTTLFAGTFSPPQQAPAFLQPVFTSSPRHHPGCRLPFKGLRRVFEAHSTRPQARRNPSCHKRRLWISGTGCHLTSSSFGRGDLPLTFETLRFLTLSLCSIFLFLFPQCLVQATFSMSFLFSIPELYLLDHFLSPSYSMYPFE